MKIRLSGDAKADLQEIFDYSLQEWGERQAESYLRDIYSRLREISENPERWRSRSELFAGCQMAPVGRHLLFFLVRKELVLVSRIIHESMDVSRHSFPFD